MADKNINRRDFLKTLGVGAAAVGTASLTGCRSKLPNEFDPAGHHTTEVPTDKMSYRQFESLGNDRVSALGYGCMRWPTLAQPEANGNVIDQEQVNQLIDYAMAHGITYYDTAPVYVQGWSEQATAKALKKLPMELSKHN